MPAYSPTIPVRYSLLLCECLDALGIDRSSVLDAAGLPRDQFDQPEALMTLVQFGALLKVVEQATGRRDLGMELGWRVRFDDHGALGRVLAQCATLDHAWRLLPRYVSLLTPAFAIEYRREGKLAEMIYRPVAAVAPEVLRVFFDAHMVSVYNLTRPVLADRAYDVYISLDAPPHLARYKELRPARVHFRAEPLPSVRIVIEASLLDLPQPTASPDLAHASLHRCKQLLDNTPQDQQWSEWVMMMLREAEGCQPSIEQLAELLRMGPRTLIRRLKQENQSFREISTRVRHERACRLLGNSRESIAQIAYRLGYQSPTSFCDAFRRVSGLSPRAFRSARAGASNLPEL